MVPGLPTILPQTFPEAGYGQLPIARRRVVISGELPEPDVTSQENCRITLIPRDAFLATVRDHPQMYFAIAKVLSNDLVMAQHILKTSLRQHLRGKVIAKPLLSGPH